MKERKIVQVAIDPSGTAALADDGTLWFMRADDYEAEWRPFPPLPPRDESEKEEG